MNGDLLRIVFVAQSVAIVVGTVLALVLLRRFVRLWEAYLNLAAKQTALAKEAATDMTERIISAVEKVPLASATKVLEGQAAVGVPPPPRSLKDSCKVLLAGTFLFLGAGSFAFAPTTGQLQGAEMDAAECLREGHLDQAVHHADKDGEPLRKAEALILLEQYDAAETLCLADGCGQSKFLLGVVADRKGFPDAAVQFYREAADLGCAQGRSALTLRGL